MRTNGLLSCNKTIIPTKLKGKENAMFYVAKIKMHDDCQNSKCSKDIAQLYIPGVGWCLKEDVHNYLILHPQSIVVGKSPFPRLFPAVSIYGEKYIRSNPNLHKYDNLLELPKV